MQSTARHGTRHGTQHGTQHGTRHGTIRTIIDCAAPLQAQLLQTLQRQKSRKAVLCHLPNHTLRKKASPNTRSLIKYRSTDWHGQCSDSLRNKVSRDRPTSCASHMFKRVSCVSGRSPRRSKSVITHPGSLSDCSCRSSLPNTSAWSDQTDYLQHTFSTVISYQCP